MGGHQCNDMLNDEWLTPQEIIKSLGKFDLDPCSPIIRPWDTAINHYSINDNGLIKDWHGRVWLNPPYGRYTGDWLNKLAMHGNGIALIFARTETDMFFEYVWNAADGLLFIKGRLYFYRVDGTRADHNSGAPSVLVAYGKDNVDILKHCGIKGKFINNKNQT